MNLPLIIAAKLDYGQPHDVAYFNEYIGPRLSDQIRWVGEVDEWQRNELMKNALCFLHPVTFKEPFGLTLIESMACGCPVVAFNHGSIPEIVENGKTGFVVEEVEEMVTVVGNIHKINRRYCRQYALKRFNASLMAKEYEKIYQKVIQLSKGKMPSQRPSSLQPQFYSFAHDIDRSS